MLGRVISGAVLPAVPDHEEPGAGDDADCVRVVVAAGDGAAVEIGSPGVGADRVAGEVADGIAELLVGGPAEADGAVLAGLASAGSDASEAGQQARDSDVGKRARQSPISASRRAARRVPARGRLVKTGASGCSASCSSICSEMALIARPAR